MCQRGLLDRVRMLSQYFPFEHQVTIDETLIQNKGDFFFVAARPGEYPMTRLGGRIYDVAWHTGCDIYVRFKTFLDSPQLFRTFRSDITNWLMEDQSLNRTINVFHVMVVGRDSMKPFYFDEEDENPSFYVQTLDVIVDQRCTFTQKVFQQKEIIST